MKIKIPEHILEGWVRVQIKTNKISTWCPMLPLTTTFLFQAFLHRGQLKLLPSLFPKRTPAFIAMLDIFQYLLMRDMIFYDGVISRFQNQDLSWLGSNLNSGNLHLVSMQLPRHVCSIVTAEEANTVSHQPALVGMVHKQGKAFLIFAVFTTVFGHMCL